MFDMQPQFIAAFRTLRPAHAVGPDLRRPRIWCAPEGEGGQGQGGGPPQGQGNGSGQGAPNAGAPGQGQGQSEGGTPTPETWEAWLAARPEAERTVIQALHDAHTSGLKTALDNERDERKRLAKELQTAADKLKDGDASKQQLTEMADKLHAASAKADFFQDAARPEIGLTDPEAAWIIASAKGDAFRDRRGNIDFELLKAAHPGLFRQAAPPKPPKGNAGDGVQGEQPRSVTMNDYLRSGLGRST